MPATSGVLFRYPVSEPGHGGPVQPSPVSFRDAANRAFSGAAPEQPDLEPDTLLAKAFIAQTFLKRLGPFMQDVFPGAVFRIGPEKDMQRAEDKTQERHKALSTNCDFSRAMIGLRSIDQIRDAISRFQERGDVTLTNPAGQSISFFICDVDDTFSRPDDDRKPGYRNLDIKIAVPMGDQSFHVCELQFIHEDCHAAYRQSHEDFQVERLARKRARLIESALSITSNAIEAAEGSADRRSLANLREQFNDLSAEYASNAALGANARRDRKEGNIRAAMACNLDALRRDGKKALDMARYAGNDNLAP